MGKIELCDGEVLEDLFGDRKIIQRPDLYRFTSDSVLLSKFARAKSGDVVADFCSGCGIVGFNFFCLNPNIKSLTLFEMQESLADMSRRTATLDDIDCTVVCTRLQDIGSEYNNRFSLILCNPPYERDGDEDPVYERAVCKKEITLTLEEAVSVAAKKLKNGGRLDIVNRADRCAELMYDLRAARLEPKRMQFISGKEGEKPYLVMVEAVKGAKVGVDILPTIVN